MITNDLLSLGCAYVWQGFARFLIHLLRRKNSGQVFQHLLWMTEVNLVLSLTYATQPTTRWFWRKHFLSLKDSRQWYVHLLGGQHRVLAKHFSTNCSKPLLSKKGRRFWAIMYLTLTFWCWWVRWTKGKAVSIWRETFETKVKLCRHRLVFLR